MDDGGAGITAGLKTRRHGVERACVGVRPQVIHFFRSRAVQQASRSQVLVDITIMSYFGDADAALNVPRAEIPRVAEAARAQKFEETFDGFAMETLDARSFVVDYKTSYQLGILRCHSGWAHVVVAAPRLDTADS